MTNTPTDIYIKINKPEGEDYVKRFNAGETITIFELSKYEDMGLKDLYVMRNDRSLLMTSLLKQTVDELHHAKGDQRISVTEKTFTISTDLLRTVGISHEAKILADNTISQMVTDIKEADKLSALLLKILNDKYSYSYKRSYLISLLFSAVLPQLEWGSGDQQYIMLQKFAMVSFFHDVYLEDEQLLKIMSLDDLRKEEGKFYLNEKELVNTHANKAASLMQTYPKLPSGVDVIVRQHHGTANGMGFPEVFSTVISPLAIAFVVIEDFANLILTSKEIKINEILSQLQAKYTLPSYRKIVTALGNMNKKAKSSH
jgi:hypothetical protein